MKGFLVLCISALFGGAVAERGSIFTFGVVVALVGLVDVGFRMGRPNIGLQVDTEPWLEAGSPSSVRLGLQQPANHVALLTGRGSTLLGETVVCVGPSMGSTALTIVSRGVLTTLQFHLLVEGVVGVGGVRHGLDCVLAAPVPVGPPALPDVRVDQFIDQLENALAEPSVLGVRPYAAGDRRSDVHWRSTARTGEMMVRERLRIDPEVSRPVLISVVTRNIPALEQGLAYARHAAIRCLQLGFDTRLQVPIRQGQSEILVTRAVATEYQIMDLLARALPTLLPPAGAPPGAAWIRIDSEVTCIAHG